MSPRAGSPRGLEGAWGGAGTPRDCCGFCFQAALAFLKPDKQEEEPLAEAGSLGFRWLSPPGSPEEQGGESGRSRGHAVPRPLVPASPELSDVNMAFVSQGAAAVLRLLSPSAQRFQPGPMPGMRNERGSSSPIPAQGAEGKGGRSRLSLQDCSYHQQSPAPAGNGTGRCPQAGWGARASPLQLPKCCVSHAGTRRGGQEQPPVRGEELRPCPGARARVSVPSWGRVTASPEPPQRQSPAEGAGRRRERSRDAETCRRY